MAERNAYKNHVVVSEAVALTTAKQSRNEIIVPSYGSDVAGVELTVSLAVTGTPSGANGASSVIDTLAIKSNDGLNILQGIGSSAIPFLCKMRNGGKAVTDTAVADATKVTYFLPLNIEAKDQNARVQLTLSPLSALATSGITACTVTYTLTFWYYSTTQSVTTEKIQGLTKTASIGTNTFGNDLPKGIVINKILFTLSTAESYLSTIRFTADGQKEMDSVTPDMLIGEENWMTISGHTSLQFNLYNAPFYSTNATALDFVMTTADTVNLYLIGTLR